MARYGLVFALSWGFLSACGPVTGGDTASEAVGLADEAFQNTLGSGFDGAVDVLALQSDGSILVGGRFRKFNDVETGPLVRLDASGHLDTAFQAKLGASFNDDVFALAVTSTGEIYVAGRFTSLQGSAAPQIARLLSDGSPDSTYNLVGTGFDAEASVLALHDNLLYVGGQFATYKGQTAGRIARLKADASLDTTFAPGTGFNLGVDVIHVQGDGRVLVGGSFTSFNSATRNRLVRLNSDGSLDVDFQTAMGSAFSGAVSALAINDRILVSGEFTNFNLTPVSCFVSLGNFGSELRDLQLDAKAHVLLAQSNGKTLAAGEFTNSATTSANRVLRFNADATPDSAFALNLGTGLDEPVLSGVLQSDGKILLGGQFTNFNGTAAPRLLRLR